MTYPAFYLRGLRYDNYLEGDELSPAALHPGKESHKNRPDGARETSINWEDDEGAVEQLRSDTSASRCGIGRLPREHFDLTAQQVCKMGGAGGTISYERKFVAGNSYHGNLLYHKDLTWAAVKKVAAWLSMVTEVVSRP